MTTVVGVPRPVLVTPIGAAAVAAVIAAVYAFSPMTVVCGGAMVLVGRAAGRGLSGRERRWVLGSLGLALALRLIALVAIYAATDPSREDFNALFGDGRFFLLRSTWIMHEWEGTPIEPANWLWIYRLYGDVKYDRSLALLQWFLGPSPYGLTLISVVAFFSAAVLLYRLARPRFGPAAATAGFVALVFWPTFAVWSISMLKESLHLLVAAIGVAAAVQAARVRARGTRLALLAVVAAALLLAGPLRTAGQWVLGGAVLFGYIVAAGTRRPALAAALAVAAIAGGLVAIRQPVVQARVEARVVDALHYHVGHVASPGKSYRAADPYFYDQWPRSPIPSFDEAARYLLRSATMFVAAPLPSHVVSASEVLFLPQHFTWYLLVLLACAGAVVGLRRDPLLTGVCVGYCLAAVAIIAPYSGNIGTLVRHRDMIVPFMVWLSGLGAVGVLDRSGPHTDAAR